MSVTQTWYMILVPDADSNTMAKEYEVAKEEASKYLQENLSALEKWKQCPESFAWYMLACDISNRHEYYNPWIDANDLKAYFSLFSQESFRSLFFKYMKFCGPKEKYGEFEVAEVVVTHGDTAPAVLFQAVGKQAVDETPGFFGSFYIRKNNLAQELERYNDLIAKQDYDSLIQRGAEFYNAPYNNSEDAQVVKEIVCALPKAIKCAEERQCDLLGLVVTAG